MSPREAANQIRTQWNAANITVFFMFFSAFVTGVWYGSRAMEKLDTLLAISADHETRLREVERENARHYTASNNP